jgi:ribose 5-phosphate isomerase B
MIRNPAGEIEYNSRVRLAIGSDHAGLELKHIIEGLLNELTVPYDDLGTTTTASVDYPDYAAKVAEAVLAHRADLGLLFCGTGIGMCIAANKIRGIRAAVVWDETSARLARAHNDVNVITLGGRTTPADRIRPILSAILSTPFEGGRHAVRVAKIARLEAKDA